MKYKITVAQVLKEDGAGNEVFETVFLQVLELDENPAADIARLLNPEPEYEEEEEEEQGAEGYDTPPTAPVPDTDVKLPATFGRMKEEEPAKHGRQLGYDRDAVIADIKANVLTVAQIAEKHGISKANAYHIKSKYVRAEEIAPDIEPLPYGPRQEPAEPTPTAYQEARDRLAVKEEVPVEERIANMAREGCSLVELEMMFPSVPVHTLREIMEQVAA